MKTSITNIIDIDSEELPQSFIDDMANYACYTDNKNAQNLYNPYDLLEDEKAFGNVFSGHDKTQSILQEIDGLCRANLCDYFRITY